MKGNEVNNKTPKIAFAIQDIVFSKADPDNIPGTITGVIQRPSEFTFLAKFDGVEHEYYDFELSEERTLVL